MRRRDLLVGAVAALATIAGATAVSRGVADSSAATQPVQSGVSLQDAFVSVNRRVSPSVVQIETGDGLGSGIVFDGKGNIVTNAHVVGYRDGRSA